MTGTMGEARTSDGSLTASLEALLGDGLPFALGPEAAAVHADRCAAALAEMEPESVPGSVPELGSGDSLLRVKLLASRAVALTQSHDAGVDRCASEATEMAERLAGHPDAELARGYALVARSAAEPMPEHTEHRLAAGREILQIAARHREPALVPIGYLIVLVALLEQGEIRSLDLELTGRGRARDQFLDQHRAEPVSWFRCLRAILDGDIATAQRLVEEQFARSRHREGSDAMAIYTSHLGIIGWMQGRVDGAEDHFASARRAHPEQVLWPASLAWLWLGQGRRTAAESLFESLQDLEQIPRDRYWLSSLTVLAEIAVHLGSRDFAERVRRRLLPYAERLVPVGIGVAFWGTCARTLGLLAERLGLLTEARAHLELAVTITRRVGAQAWLAEAQIELAEFALRHGLGDVPAYELLAEARATCVARGFDGLHRRTLGRPRITVMGSFEVISADGVRAEWTSRKARDLLKMLVAARGVAVAREIYMDRLWPGVEPAQLANRFAVAISTIRRALDPQRSLPRGQHVVVDGDGVRLDLAHVDVDLERFLAVARHPDPEVRASARELYRGGPFPDEPYADWAIEVREAAERVWHSLG